MECTGVWLVAAVDADISRPPGLDPTPAKSATWVAPRKVARMRTLENCSALVATENRYSIIDTDDENMSGTSRGTTLTHERRGGEGIIPHSFAFNGHGICGDTHILSPCAPCNKHNVGFASCKFKGCAEGAGGESFKGCAEDGSDHDIPEFCDSESSGGETDNESEDSSDDEGESSEALVQEAQVEASRKLAVATVKGMREKENWWMQNVAKHKIPKYSKASKPFAEEGKNKKTIFLKR